jgi:hypothetical protein
MLGSTVKTIVFVGLLVGGYFSVLYLLDNMEERTAKVEYVAKMRNLQLNIAECEQDVRGGAPGQLICYDQNHRYPVLPQICNQNKPYYALLYGDGMFELDVWMSEEDRQTWSCLGCVIRCTEQGCEQSEECL